jgi:hypothetical protein
MNDTPDEPRPPGEDPGDQQDRWPYRQTDSPPSTDEAVGAVGASQPGQPPMEPASQPPYDDTNPGFGDLPPLDEDEAPPRRRLLSGGRLVAASVAVVVLLGGGVALARGGDSDGDGSDGVATVDGSSGDQAADADDQGGGNSGRPDQSEMQDAMLEYAECMRDHGIDMPDPEFSGDGGGMVIQGGGPDGGGSTGGGPAPDSDEFEAADDACSDIMDDVRGDMPQLSPEEQAEMQDKLVAMAQCMRDKGYDMPDPEVNGDGGVQIQMRGGPGGPQGDGSGPDEQMQQDQEECNEQAGMENGPLGGPGGGPATDSSGDDGDGGTT